MVLERSMPKVRDWPGSASRPEFALPLLPEPGSVPHGRVLNVGMAELLGNRSLAASLEAAAGVDIRREVPVHVAVHGVADRRDWREIRKLVSGWNFAANRRFALQFPGGIRPGCLRRADTFGNIRMYLRTDSAEQLTATDWERLQRCKHIHPYYGKWVRSVCPLLGDESATELLPGCNLLGPPGSAWLPLHVDLARLATRAAVADKPELEELLIRSLHVAETLLNRSEWITTLQRADASSNRRVAIFIDGIGDLVAESGRDPRRLDTLRFMQRLLADIRDTLITSSRSMARRAGRMPVLKRNPRWDTWSSELTARIWQQRYEEACQQFGTRHRNLLAITPYSVLPKLSVARPEFADLLPLIAIADAWGFAGGDACRHWAADDARRFHERARAVIDSATASSRIAGGV